MATYSLASKLATVIAEWGMANGLPPGVQWSVAERDNGSVFIEVRRHEAGMGDAFTGSQLATRHDLTDADITLDYLRLYVDRAMMHYLDMLGFTR